MKSMNGYHPLTVILYYAALSAVVMITMNALLIVIGLISSLTCYFMIRRSRDARSDLYFALLFLIMVAVNPIFSHKGVTVLFVLNDTPVTLEAFLFGIFASAMAIEMIYFFRSLSVIMTEDKLLAVFGVFSPKAALILSMALRYVPLFGRQAGKIEKSQKALGIYKEDSVPDALRAKLRIFSVLCTWALENGIITADSMSARGYGVRKRTEYKIYKFTKADALFLSISAALLAVVVSGALAGALKCDYYPTFKLAKPSLLSYIAYVSYALLAFIPIITETGERIKWKYLTSGI